MNESSAHTSRWKILEVVFGGPFLVGIGLHFIVPFAAPQGLTRQILLLVGLLLVVAGIGLISLTRREFARYRQPTDPGQPTSQVIQTGAFSFSRNPLSLASLLLFLGIALAVNVLWAVGAVLVSAILCLVVLILPEEKYLAVKFGQDYLDYTRTVHRWLGRK